MPQRKIPNVTQQQIDHAQMRATELFERSSNMTRSDFNHVVAEDILHNQEKYRTVEDVLKGIDYCRETGDDIRADAMDEYLKGEFYLLEKGRSSQWRA